MIPLFIKCFIIAIKQWYTTNTKSPIQKKITEVKELMICFGYAYTRENHKDYLSASGYVSAFWARKDIRKETFRITSIYCYSLFMIGMTLLTWKITQ